MKYLPTFCVLVLASSSFVAEAKECRATKTVIDSTVDEPANKSAGGHVSQHVVGYEALKDKTQFMDWPTFTKAFALWQAVKTTAAASCSEKDSGTRVDCVDAGTVGVTTAQKCRATDSKNGCAKSPPPTSFVPAKVVFRYENDNNSKNVWAMRTAFPADGCPKSKALRKAQ